MSMDMIVFMLHLMCGVSSYRRKLPVVYLTVRAMRRPLFADKQFGVCAFFMSVYQRKTRASIPILPTLYLAQRTQKLRPTRIQGKHHETNNSLKNGNSSCASKNKKPITNKKSSVGRITDKKKQQQFAEMLKLPSLVRSR